jgi:hypothetical protein
MPLLASSVRSPTPSASRCAASHAAGNCRADGDDVAVMEQAVENGGCHYGIAEHDVMPHSPIERLLVISDGEQYRGRDFKPMTTGSAGELGY